MEADKDGDGKLSFDEFALMVSNTVSSCCDPFTHSPPGNADVHRSGHRKTNDARGSVLRTGYVDRLGQKKTFFFTPFRITLLPHCLFSLDPPPRFIGSPFHPIL